MIIRDYRSDAPDRRSTDRADLEEIHSKQGIDYPFPAIDSPSFLLRAVLEAHGHVRAAALARLTCEVYLLMDPTFATPMDRWNMILALQDAAIPEAYRRGLTDAHCWVPPAVARHFDKRMGALGWSRPLWPCYWRMLAPAVADKKAG